jgi:DNA-binding NarL/FixJ family response regulator
MPPRTSDEVGPNDDRELTDLLHSLQDHRHRTVELLMQLEQLVEHRLTEDRKRCPDDAQGNYEDKLTDREKSVAELLKKGMSNRMIARSLAISEQTVKNHLHSVFHKLGVTDRTQAVIALIQGAETDAPRH